MRLPHCVTRRDFVLTALAGIAGLAYEPSAHPSRETRSDTDVQLLDLTISEVVPLLRNGDLSAETYARALLSQISRQRQLNAFIFLDDARVMDDAAAADKRRNSGAKLGPLHGLPVPIKDNIDTVDAPTSGGTPALRRHRPKSNAPVAQSLFSAGAFLLGK